MNRKHCSIRVKSIRVFPVVVRHHSINFACHWTPCRQLLLCSSANRFYRRLFVRLDAQASSYMALKKAWAQLEPRERQRSLCWWKLLLIDEEQKQLWLYIITLKSQRTLTNNNNWILYSVMILSALKHIYHPYLCFELLPEQTLEPYIYNTKLFICIRKWVICTI